MVKVFANSMIDLDIIPGASQQDLKAQAQAHLGSVNEAAQDHLDSTTSAQDIVDKLPQAQREQLSKGLDNLTPEQRQQLQDAVSGHLTDKQKQTFMSSMSNTAKSVVGTGGAAVKGVGDTVGNTVGALGRGLGQTATGVAGVLGDAANSAGGMFGAAKDNEKRKEE